VVPVGQNTDRGLVGQKTFGARLAQNVLAGPTGAWALFLFLAPAATFPFGQFICHQKPERSFFINGLQMAVCARCTGLYIGAAAAMPLALGFAAPLTTTRARWIALLAALPTAITWSLEFAGLAGFSNMARFIAALPLGFAAAWLIVGVLAEL
jgi:uncharacterized membrane protein